MARLARVPGNLKTRREGYESVDHHTSDEEFDLIDRNKTSKESSRGKRRGKHGAGVEAEQSSDDEHWSGDQDRVKLASLNQRKELRSQGNGSTVAYDNLPASSATQPRDAASEENLDVGEAIEQVLERERTMLSESFDTDLEDGGSHLILSDDDSDGYGIPNDKGRRKAQHGAGQNWSSGLRSIFPLKIWWQVFPFAVVGLLVMWLATKGLGWLRSEPARDEYVRRLF